MIKELMLLIPVIIIFGTIILIYFSFEIKVDDEIFKIRSNWINTNDLRYKKYSWNDMLKKSNVFKLKMPKDEDFK